LEVSLWNYLTLSNWNVMFFVGLASVGLIINWLLWRLPFFGRLDKKRTEKMVVK
jgi:hypothetical protein